MRSLAVLVMINRLRVLMIKRSRAEKRFNFRENSRSSTHTSKSSGIRRIA